jgi:hypothetical protein
MSNNPLLKEDRKLSVSCLPPERAMQEIGKCSISEKRSTAMRKNEEGKAGWILLWAIGVPIPVLLLLFLLRGCT